MFRGRSYSANASLPTLRGGSERISAGTAARRETFAGAAGATDPCSCAAIADQGQHDRGGHQRRQQDRQLGREAGYDEAAACFEAAPRLFSDIARLELGQDLEQCHAIGA